MSFSISEKLLRNKIELQEKVIKALQEFIGLLESDIQAMLDKLDDKNRHIAGLERVIEEDRLRIKALTDEINSKPLAADKEDSRIHG